jgi:hypothetical protein
VEGILERERSAEEEVTEVGVTEGGAKVDGEGRRKRGKKEGKGPLPSVLFFAQRFVEGVMEEEGLMWREGRREGGREGGGEGGEEEKDGGHHEWRKEMLDMSRVRQATALLPTLLPSLCPSLCPSLPPSLCPSLLTRRTAPASSLLPV